LHAVHQDRADHASPADQADAISDFFHVFALSINVFLIPGSSGREGRDEPKPSGGCLGGFGNSRDSGLHDKYSNLSSTALETRHQLPRCDP
jgi:hypothetical protein